MNTKASTTIRAGTALVLASFVWAGGAMAQEDTAVAHMDRPADNAASCEAMIWNQEFVGTYPWVSEACHTVIIVNGERWARFEGKFQEVNNDGSFDTEFVSRSNRELGRVTLMPEPGQRVHLDNQDVRFSDLSRGQILSFYVPEDAIGFSVDPVAPRTQLVTIVTRTDDAEVAVVTTPEEEPILLAQAEPRSEPLASELPRTAGPLPLIALGGLMSLLGGLGLTLRRRSSNHNS